MATSLEYSPDSQADPAAAQLFLRALLVPHLSAEDAVWLDGTLTQLRPQPTTRELYAGFGAAGRRVSNAPLALTAADTQTAHALRPGFDPTRWTARQTARTLLLLTGLPPGPATAESTLQTLCATADLGELTALYAALPLLPHPAQWQARAAEGIRTNLRPVFDAVALNNPYPADYLPEAAWNQLVLKALFTDRPLRRIVGFDARRNLPLARTLAAYAHERWAAGRPVTPALWRATGPFVDDALLEDLRHALAQPDLPSQQAAALACAESPYPPAADLLATRPDLRAAIASGALTWAVVGQSPD